MYYRELEITVVSLNHGVVALQLLCFRIANLRRLRSFSSVCLLAYHKLRTEWPFVTQAGNKFVPL
jgi:hypothetical protein